MEKKDTEFKIGNTLGRGRGRGVSGRRKTLDELDKMLSFRQFFYNNEVGKEAPDARTSTPLSIDSGIPRPVG